MLNAVLVEKLTLADMHHAQRLKSLANWLANWGVKITGPMAYGIDAANRSTKVSTADNCTEEIFVPMASDSSETI